MDHSRLVSTTNIVTYWRHGPEAQSVFVTFASAFLVKLLQPKFASYLTMEKRIEIRELVQKVIDLLSSPEIAIDDRHGPKLYSKFLKGLLAAPMARVDSTPSARKARRPKSSSGQTPEPTSEANYGVYNHPSPAGSASLSPPPRSTALSFDSFAPVGATDPFAPELAGTSNPLNISGVDEGTGINMSNFFQPPLPFDEDILQSMQSLSDPSGWQDTTLPCMFFSFTNCYASYLIYNQRASTGVNSSNRTLDWTSGQHMQRCLMMNST
jgi:hypothetical protein